MNSYLEKVDILALKLRAVSRTKKDRKRPVVFPNGGHFTILNANNHPRPISLTHILSKVPEEYVVEGHVKPAVRKKVDRNQFGTVPNSCTMYALIICLITHCLKRKLLIIPSNRQCWTKKLTLIMEYYEMV